MNVPTPAHTSRAQLRLANIRSEISGRLWSINAGMSSAAYNELMDQMSMLQLNAELRDAASPGHVDTRVGPAHRRGLGVFMPLGGFPFPKVEPSGE